MEFKNPIETAKEILERTISENTGTEECVECNEEVEEVIEETDEVEEGYGKVMSAKKKGEDDEEVDEAKDDEEDDDDDEEEVEEGKVPPQFAKNMKKKDDDSDDEDEDDDEEKVDEAAEVIVDTERDAQTADGKKAKAVRKGGSRMKDADRKGKGKSGKGGVPEVVPANMGDHVNPSAKVKEHIDALFNGEELTEEFRDKATTIFEAAVSERVVAIEEELVAQYNEKLEEGITTVKDELTEKLDDYLGYVVEEWMKENEVAIENGLRNEIAENFITGLKSLFESCYIDVPNEKYDVLTDYADKVNSLEESLNAEMAKGIELRKELLESNCTSVFNNVVDGLVDTEVEKLRSLAEGLEFENVEQYEEKLNLLKENYFNDATADESNEPVINNDEQKADGVMGLYMQSLSRINKKK